MIKNIFILISFFVWIFLSAPTGFAQNKSGSTNPPSQVTIWYESLRNYIKSKISGEERKVPALPVKASADVSAASKDSTAASSDISQAKEVPAAVSLDTTQASADATPASMDDSAVSEDSSEEASADQTNAEAAQKSLYAEYYKIRLVSGDVTDVKTKAGFAFRMQQQKEAMSIIAIEKLTTPNKAEVDKKKALLKEIKRIKDEMGLKPNQKITPQLMDPKSPQFNAKYYYLRKAISFYSKRIIFGVLEFNNRFFEGKIYTQDLEGFEKEFHIFFRKDFRNSLPAFDAEAKEFLGMTTVRGLQIVREGTLKQKMLNTMVNKKDEKTFAEWVDRVDLFYPRYLAQLMADYSYQEVGIIVNIINRETKANKLVRYRHIVRLAWLFGQMNLEPKRASLARLAVKKIICSRPNWPPVPNRSALRFDVRCPVGGPVNE